VHLIVIEKWHQSNFFKYFDLLDRGVEESRAFGESFDVSYEALDKMFQDAVNARKITMLTVPVRDEPDASSPVQLSDAEANGRLALVGAAHNGEMGEALKLASEAVKVEPNNEHALAALVTVRLAQTDYPLAFEVADRLCVLEPLSPASAGRCGQFFFSLSVAVSQRKASVGADATALAARARTYFEAAIAKVPDDLRSWTGLLDLIVNTRDVEYAKTLRPKAESVLAEHSRSGELARSVAGLCGLLKDYESALKYALMWQRYAINGSRRALATADVSRLQAYLERERLKGEAPPRSP
jgi:hypothetical protein